MAGQDAYLSSRDRVEGYGRNLRPPPASDTIKEFPSELDEQHGFCFVGLTNLRSKDKGSSKDDEKGNQDLVLMLEDRRENVACARIIDVLIILFYH